MRSPLRHALSEIRDGLKYIGSDYVSQIKLHPDFAHIPDEVLNAMPTDQVDFLVKNKVLTEELAKKILNFRQELDTLPLSDDNDEMLEYIKSEKFDVFRKKSLELLDILNQHVANKQIPGVSPMIEIKKILLLDQKKLVFIGYDGQERTIDFWECKKNYDEYCLVDSEDFVPRTPGQSNVNFVGRRNIIDGLFYVEFFSSPHAYIEFKQSFSMWNPQRKFVDFYKKIGNLGWETFDMTEENNS